jgi:hypothetical protein
LSTHLLLGRLSGLLPSGFPPISYMHSSSPFVLHALPISSSLTYHSNYVWREVQVMKLLIMQLPPISRHFISLRFKYSPQHLFTNTLSLYSSLNLRDQAPHPYRTISKLWLRLWEPTVGVMSQLSDIRQPIRTLAEDFVRICYQETTSEDTEDFMCAAVTVTFRVCKLVRML